MAKGGRGRGRHSGGQQRGGGTATMVRGAGPGTRAPSNMADAAQRGGAEVQPWGLADAMNAIAARAGMSNPMPRSPLDQVPFGPNWALPPQPLDPARPDTGRPEPRVFEYPVAFNIPGNGNRPIPWDTLYAASTNVDIIRRCIEIRKRHLRGMEWGWAVTEEAIAEALLGDPAAGRMDVETKLREQYLPEIRRATEFWKKPWRANGLSFGQWLNGWMDQHLVLDGVAVYPRMTYGGDVTDLEIIDASTIKLLLDNRGARPEHPFPAFQQELYGFPRGEFTVSVGPDGMMHGGYAADQLYYHRENFRPQTPYGFSAVEQSLISARLYLKRQGWMLAEYDDGSTPLMWLVPAPTAEMWSQMSADQRRRWEQSLNDELAGNQGGRHRVKVTPPGFNPIAMPSVDERYKPEYDMFLIKMAAGFFNVTVAELGLTEPKGLGSSGYHEGQEAVEGRVGQRPDTVMVAESINDLSYDFLRIPREIEFKFIDPQADDEKTKAEVAGMRRARGTITLNDERREIGMAPLPFKEADMPMLLAGDKATPLEGLAKVLELAQQAQQASLEASNAQMEADGEAADLEAEELEGASAEKALEMASYRRWARKRGGRAGRMFICKALDPADWPGSAVPADVDFEHWEWVPDDAEIVKAFGGNDNWRTLARDHRGRWMPRGRMRVDPLGPATPGKEVLSGLQRQARAGRAGVTAAELAEAQASFDQQAGPGPRGEARRRLMESAGITPESIARERRAQREQAERAKTEREQAERDMLRAHAARLDPADIEAGRAAHQRRAEELSDKLGGKLTDAQRAEIDAKWADPERQAVLVANDHADRARQASRNRAEQLGETAEEQRAAELRNEARRAEEAAAAARERAEIEAEEARMAAANKLPEFPEELGTAKEEAARLYAVQGFLTRRYGDGWRFAEIHEAHHIALRRAESRLSRAKRAAAETSTESQLSSVDTPTTIDPVTTTKPTKRSYTVTLPDGSTQTRRTERDYTHAVILTKDNHALAAMFEERASTAAERGRQNDAERAAAAAASYRALPQYEHSLVSMSGSEAGARKRADELVRKQGAWFSAEVREVTADAPAQSPAAVTPGAGNITAREFPPSVADARHARVAAEEGPRDKAERLAREREAADPMGEAARLDRVAEGWERALRTPGDGTRDAMARNNAEHARSEAARIRAAHTAPDADSARAAYAELTAANGGNPVALAELRAKLGGTREQQDSVLRGLAGSPDVAFFPEENQKVRTAADDAAALHIGGENKDLISIDSPREQATPLRGDDDLLDDIEAMGRSGVSLAALRRKMGGTRAEQDAALKRLDRARVIVLDPDPNRKALTQEARDAAMEIGGEPKHLVSILNRPSRQAPAETSEQAAERIAADTVRRMEENRRASLMLDHPVFGPGGDTSENIADYIRQRGAQYGGSLDSNQLGLSGISGAKLDVAVAQGRVVEIPRKHSMDRTTYRAATPEEMAAHDALVASSNTPARSLILPDGLDDKQRERYAAMGAQADARHPQIFAESRATLERGIEGERSALANPAVEGREREHRAARLANMEALLAAPRGDAAVQATKPARELVEAAESKGMVVLIQHNTASGGEPFFTVQALDPATNSGFTATFHTFKGKNGSYGLQHADTIKDGRRSKATSAKALREHVEAIGAPKPDAEVEAERHATSRTVNPAQRIRTQDVQVGDWRYHPTEGWQKIGMIENPGLVRQRVIWGEDRETKLGTLAGDANNWIARTPDRPTMPPAPEMVRALQRKPGEAVKRGDILIAERKDTTYYGGNTGISNPRIAYHVFEVTSVTRDGKPREVRHVVRDSDLKPRPVKDALHYRLYTGKTSVLPGDAIDREGLEYDLRQNTFPGSTTPRDVESLGQLGEILAGRVRQPEPAAPAAAKPRKPKAAPAPQAPAAPAAPSAQSVNDVMAAQMANALANPTAFGPHGTKRGADVKRGDRLMFRNQHAVEVLEDARRAAPDSQGRTGWVFRVRREDGGVEGTMRVNDADLAALAAPRPGRR